MPKPLTITAICGWAVPKRWFEHLIHQRFPNYLANVIYPQNPLNQTESKSILSKITSDLIIGYSLGSLWILYYRHYISPRIKIALLAPILALPKEHKLGGKISEIQIKYISKMISRNPDDNSPILSFYNLSGFQPPDSLLNEFTDKERLINGLRFLYTARASGQIESDIISIIGETDPLLDAEILKHYIPNLIIIPHKGHAPEPLLDRLSKDLIL
tara:strand:- start:1396 stop:2040 length:645 start_codon:yes stop_codon:yes gene_type:complete